MGLRHIFLAVFRVPPVGLVFTGLAGLIVSFGASFRQNTCFFLCFFGRFGSLVLRADDPVFNGKRGFLLVFTFA